MLAIDITQEGQPCTCLQDMSTVKKRNLQQVLQIMFLGCFCQIGYGLFEVLYCRNLTLI